MHMKATSAWGHGWQRMVILLLRGQALLLAGLLIAGWGARAEEPEKSAVAEDSSASEEKKSEAEQEKPDATEQMEETQAEEPEAKEPEAEEEKKLSPEEIFEGGTETYTSWLELSGGGFFIDGSKRQFQQRHRTEQKAFGGIEDFHYQGDLGKGFALTLDGRSIFDNEDYKLSLDLAKENLGFLRFKYESFRTWYNGDGGWYSPGDVWYQLRESSDALALDRGEFSAEMGLTLKNLPALTFKYTHRYRDGEKSSTIWGPSHPTGTSLTRGLSPSFYDIDEESHIFELDAKHQIKATALGLGLRYETTDVDNARKMTFWPQPDPSPQRRVTDREDVSYDLFNVHTFSETWIKKNLFFSTGFSFSDLDNDFTGSRIYGDEFDVVFVPNPANSTGYTNLVGNSRKQEYVANLNLMAIPLAHFTIVPSVRIQREDWDAESRGFQTGVNPSGGFAGNTDGDRLDVRERLDLRYTGVTNWVFFARGEWTQGEGNAEERGGIGPTAPIARETEDTRFFQKYSAGAKWYATRSFSIDAGGYYKLNAYDYDHSLDSTPNAGANRYPAYLVMQDFETYDGNVRITLRPLKNLTLVSRYEYQLSTINTKPDSASGLGQVESSEMTSHIIAQNVSWTPWSRLYLQAGFNYVLSETETPASGFIPEDLAAAPILEAQNNYWTLNFSSGLVLDDKTDLNVGYSYYRADNFKDNASVGVPYGAGAEEHGVTATLTRRLTQNLRLTLKYGYFDYQDETSGGHNNYQAHYVSSSLQYRF